MTNLARVNLSVISYTKDFFAEYNYGASFGLNTSLEHYSPELT